MISELMGPSLESVKNRQPEAGARPSSMEIPHTSECFSETAEAVESTIKECPESKKILTPDMETIKTQSLEAVKLDNAEKAQVTVKEDTLRELTAKEKHFLKINTHLCDTAIDNIHVDKEGNYRLKCRNEELVGRNHNEISEVKYIEKEISLDDIKIVVVVPEFPAHFECTIPKELWEAGDREIFKSCTGQLRDYLETHPEMQSNFSAQQLEQISNGEPYIRGFSWHHTEVPGKMQLVETKVHAACGHTGGNVIWCGGIR